MMATSRGDIRSVSTYVPKEALIRASLLTRPSPILIHLVRCIYILVSGQPLPKFPLQIQWLSIRKILLVDDLELQLMCFDLGSVPDRLRREAERILDLVDERDALRCGPEAMRVYEWLSGVLRVA